MPATVRLQLVPTCWGAGPAGVSTSSSNWSSCSRSANCCPSGSALLLEGAWGLHRQLLLIMGYMQAVNCCPGVWQQKTTAQWLGCRACRSSTLLGLRILEIDMLPTGFDSDNACSSRNRAWRTLQGAEPPVRLKLPRTPGHVTPTEGSGKGALVLVEPCKHLPSCFQAFPGREGCSELTEGFGSGKGVLTWVEPVAQQEELPPA